MRESVIYQEIHEEAWQEGLQQGLKREALSFVTRQLRRQVGLISSELQRQVESLSLLQLED